MSCIPHNSLFTRVHSFFKKNVGFDHKHGQHIGTIGFFVHVVHLMGFMLLRHCYIRQNLQISGGKTLMPGISLCAGLLGSLGLIMTLATPLHFNEARHYMCAFLTFGGIISYCILQLVVDLKHLHSLKSSYSRAIICLRALFLALSLVGAIMFSVYMHANTGQSHRCAYAEYDGVDMTSRGFCKKRLYWRQHPCFVSASLLHKLWNNSYSVALASLSELVMSFCLGINDFHVEYLDALLFSQNQTASRLPRQLYAQFIYSFVLQVYFFKRTGRR